MGSGNLTYVLWKRGKYSQILKFISQSHTIKIILSDMKNTMKYITSELKVNGKVKEESEKNKREHFIRKCLLTCLKV